MNKKSQTAQAILDTAESIVQESGFNGFSYAHIADKVGIRTASIHYHFPNKEDLAVALIERYTDKFVAASARIDAESPNAPERLRKFIAMYRDPVLEYRTCLGVMFSSDASTLSEKAQEQLTGFISATLSWLEQVLSLGRSEGTLRFEGDAETQAHIFLASLQGAQLLARSFRDIRRFDQITEELISAFA
ncbi:TetR/AcrR family transcriptional regulator [Cohnella suwonensis]|uniref:TetR/AcrR family transcriptional regulator n=1 Tax=Cohnella suwonensis TaxID=696072 RepID=A0ABW0M2S3_9BACL